MKQNKLIWILVAIFLAACSSIKNSSTETGSDILPKQPDYNADTQWYVTERQGKADIFYITSTETGDYLLADGTACHYADTYADSLRGPILAEMMGVDTLLSGGLNFYSPYYRQCSLQTFADDSLTEARMTVPTGDVHQAFAHYLAHQNQGRPFILAGFSQGAMILLELLREMDDDTYQRMIAAYAIGVSIPQAMADTCKHLVAAQGADDTGVTICYNSARSPECALWPRSAFCINPVNWRTDSTPATLITEPTPLLPIDQQQKETLTVRLDSQSNLLLVSGYTATDYILPLLGVEGNYHTREIWLYRDCLRTNITVRASEWRKKY